MTMTDQPPTELPDPEVVLDGEPRPEVHAQPTPEPEPAAVLEETAHLPAVIERTHLIPGSDLPIIPGGGELRDLAGMAVTLAGAQAVPAALRGRPNDVFQVLLTARDLGVAVTTAMREFHVIDGRVTLSPKVKLAMVNERGVRDGWAVWPDPANDKVSATWYATRRDRPGLTFSSTFTYEDAQNVGNLVNKDNWKRYPQRMLSWRALGYLLDDVFPEVATGIYSPDELGGMTDEEGRVIDVASAAPLPGTTGPAPPAPDATVELADEDTRFLLLCRIAALPEESQEALRERWAANSSLKGRSVRNLPVSAARGANALLNGIEKEAERGGWIMEEAHAAVAAAIEVLAGAGAEEGDGSAAQEGQDEPGEAGGPDGAEEAPEAASGAQGPAGEPSGTAEDLERDTILAVKAMELTEVDAELRRLGKPVEGAGGERRASLVLAILVEAGVVTDPAVPSDT